MRALVQRGSHASVTIDGVNSKHGKSGMRALVLLGITDGDTEDDAVLICSASRVIPTRCVYRR